MNLCTCLNVFAVQWRAGWEVASNRAGHLARKRTEIDGAAASILVQREPFSPGARRSSLQMSDGGGGAAELMMIATPAGHLGRHSVPSTSGPSTPQPKLVIPVFVAPRAVASDPDPLGC